MTGIAMFVWFFVCVIGFLLMIPLHFWSVEHQKLERKFGKKGVKIGEILGLFSGWMELMFLLGFWISPQPRFIIFPSSSISIPFTNFSIPILHLVVALPFFLVGAGIAIWGLKVMSAEIGFWAIDAHSKPSKIVTSGPYSIIRHPQYLGADLAHVGGSILFSALYALVFTPVYVLCNYLISRKEEKELARELGEEYKEYQKSTPMFLPEVREK